MIGLKVVRPTIFFSGAFLLVSSLLWGADAIISKVPDSSGTYCHLRFPAIKENTLYWKRPVLKDRSSNDVIDFYGPCNYDPLGREEVLRQRDQYEHRLRRLPESEGA
jgi:hypothetical protein